MTRLDEIVELTRLGWLSGAVPMSYALAVRDLADGTKTLAQIEKEWAKADGLAKAFLGASSHRTRPE